MRRWSPVVASILGAALLVAAVGCAQVVVGTPTPADGPAAAAPSATPVAPQDVDGLSSATANDLQAFWRSEFPAAFGRPWRDITSFRPAHPQDRSAAPPPCVDATQDVADDAFYCPQADAVVWDADGLVPELNRRFGAAGVVVVLAHEVGHAVQTRLGVDDEVRADPAHHPTILLESMADCYAGVAMAHFADHPVAGRQIDPQQRDAALLALVGFSDPLGVQAADSDAHGDAFDRVSAFQDGYVKGPAECAAMTIDNRAFTQRRFVSADDEARRGDLPLPDLIEAVQDDARTWFSALVPGWTAPALRTTPSPACPAPEQAAQGPTAFCPTDGAVSVDRTALTPIHRQIGDYADGTLIAARYALAARAAAGHDPAGPGAGDAAVCLAGAYTARLLDKPEGFSLSPGDLDEAVQVLIAHDWAARDGHGAVDPAETGFDRLTHFRTGVLGGPGAC